MFICQVSGKQSQANEKPLRLITKTRTKQYPVFDKRGFQVRLAEGWEIVEEKLVCKEVYDQLSPKHQLPKKVVYVEPPKPERKFNKPYRKFFKR